MNKWTDWVGTYPFHDMLMKAMVHRTLDSQMIGPSCWTRDE